METITLPSGIGDALWVLQTLDPSKKYNFDIVKSDKNRVKEFLEMFPFTNKATYTNKTYPKDVTYPMNKWLEDGNRIENFNGYVNWKLQPSIGVDNLKKANNIIERYSQSKPIIGIYTSSTASNKAWKGWTSKEWNELISMIKGCDFIGIGAEYDNLLDEVDIPNAKGASIEVSTQLLCWCDLVIGFPSGIPIIAQYFDVPTIMFFPKHLEKMKYSFNKSHTFKAIDFISPEEVYKIVKEII